MKALLERLFDYQQLDRSAAKALMLDMAKASYNPAQVAALLTVYQMRAISLEELAGFRDALLELAIPFDLEGRTTLDIVGTGGDGKNTFNISTLSAVVVAGAGFSVTKHGSYGVSSAVGSSDVLQALGYEFTTDRDQLLRGLDASGLCFLHAPLFHPALKEVGPIRKQLGVKTFFNMLGPLVNPAQPTHQVFGTFSMALSRLYHYIMQDSGRAYAIVYSLDGYDEVSLTGPAKIYHHSGERILNPHDWGLPQLQQIDLDGGNTAEEAKNIFLRVLDNTASPAQIAAVLANAALAIQTLRPTSSLTDCVAEARQSIESGRAKAALQQLLTR